MKTAREGDTPSTLLFHFYGNNETKFPKIFRVRIRTPIAGGTVTALAIMPEAQLCLFCSPQGNGPRKLYVLHVPHGGAATVTLRPGRYEAKWFNRRTC